MAKIFWKLVSRWAVPRRSFDVLEALSDEQGRLYEKAKQDIVALNRRLERFQGKVVIGPSYHKHVARLLSLACELAERPSAKARADLVATTMALQDSKVVISMDGALDG